MKAFNQSLKDRKKMQLPSVEELLIKNSVDPVQELLNIVTKSPNFPEQKKADIFMALLPYYHPKPKVEIGYERNPNESNPLENLTEGDLMELLRTANGNGHTSVT